ncbi:MAG: TonB-dependent receptor family protein [Gammaproteobacteria bacterium]
MTHCKRNTLSLSIALLTLSAVGAPAFAQEELLIIGSKEAARRVAGSGSVIGQEQLRVEAATDINQLLKTVPGIYIREEDGEGLRPNIGIRGATSERSSKITLMEDGVLVAPAPYADPSAYYFPTAARQSAVEVLKGAPLLRHGPQTTGGVVNLVSTAIPEDNNGALQVSTDQRGSSDVHGWWGAQEGAFSWLLETVQRDGEGFKDIDRTNDDAGFDIEDYVAKLAWESQGDGPQQSLFLKAQYSEELSNETYLGLTDIDFKDDANRRYGLSSIDQMDNRHSALQANYSIALQDNLTVSLLAYRNDFHRDWFKLSGGSAFINAANAGDATAQGILDGDIDQSDLNYKHNNRYYESQGVELNFALTLDQHSIDFGVRDHEDESDRYQETEIYDQVRGNLEYQNTVLPGASDNRIDSAEALTFWLMDSWQVNERLNVVTALRHESVDSNQQRFNAADRSVLGASRSNTSREWLPGASFTYDLSDQWQLLAGVHRGFSPIGGSATEEEEPETSDNWEAGFRYAQNAWFVEAIGFYSDFSDKSENCSIASPCSNGDTSGTYTTGEATVSGIEFQASTSFALGEFTMPLDISYTWTDAEISHDNLVTGVLKGDLLKDVPEHLYSVRAGLEHQNGWNNYIVAKYVDEQCVSVSCNRAAGPRNTTDTLLVIDLISRYQLNDKIEAFLKIENLLDEQEIVSRNPDGARPNKARTASIGLAYQF